MNRQEKHFYLASSLSLLLLPLISYPFGLHNSLGFVAGISSAILIISYSQLLVELLLRTKRKKYVFLSSLPRFALLFALAFFLSLYPEKVSPLTFVFGFVIIIFVMLFSHLSEE